MGSAVYYIPQDGGHAGMAEKLRSFLADLDLPWVKSNSKIGVKVHWGEPGNITFLPSDYAKATVSTLIEKGATPFLFDTTTLYHGDRRDPVDNLWTAHRHGFGYNETGAPVLVGDGISGKDIVELPVPGNPTNQKSVKVASLVNYVDGIVTVSHFKGHMASGFGGAIKNIAMGMASRATKQVMHAEVIPELKQAKCTGCGVCVRICPENAIAMFDEYPKVDRNKCVGCAECIAMCPEGAYRILWSTTPEKFLEKMVETATAVCDRLSGRMLHIEILANITPECDCMSRPMEPLTSDLGILVSADPVAIDAASCDIFNGAEPLENTQIRKNRGDYILQLFPSIPYRYQFEYAGSLGASSGEYELIVVK